MNQWCWFELKARHVGQGEREIRAEKSAQGAFVKDIVALMGFDQEKTTSVWNNPPTYVQSHIIQTHLARRSADLQKGQLQFVTALLTIDQLQKQDEGHEFEKLASSIKKKAHSNGLKETPKFEITSHKIAGGSLLLATF